MATKPNVRFVASGGYYLVIGYGCMAQSKSKNDAIAKWRIYAAAHLRRLRKRQEIAASTLLIF